MKYKLYNNIFGWIAFAVSAVTYLLTIEPTTSFWDCGEFIGTAFKLEVGHPPGAPLFMIMARIAGILGGSPDNAAVMVNAMSGLASAFTILFLFWTITHFAKRAIVKEGEINLAQMIMVLGSGMVGALAYAFSDTFWFSAVEGEVYASSSFFTAIVFWVILKWENVYDQKYANRWIILIAYLMGLSIGVHLLNLLAIPAIVFVYYFKKYTPSLKGVIYSAIISVVLLVAIMYGVIQGAFKVASGFELAFVNSFGMPFNSGLTAYLILLLAACFGAWYYSTRSGGRVMLAIFVSLYMLLSGVPMMLGSTVLAVLFVVGSLVIVYYTAHLKALYNTLVLSITVIIIGYSSFAMIMIRSNANPPMDENNPENVFALISYLNREQYGDRPLFYGQYFNSPLDKSDPVTKGDPIYVQKGDKYVIADYKESYNYDSRFCTVFPRMYSSEGSHVSAYKNWTNFKGTTINAVGPDGSVQRIQKPTFVENLKFFFSYQIGHMYLRYFMWNFVGRQNDIQGHGGILYGNWMSGISFIDEMNVGPQEKVPDVLKNNKARNIYFALPLLLGLLGFFYQFNREKKGFWLVLLLYFFTGIAIVLYLNQYPYQPRERDYAYAASFYAFAIWIGLGAAAIYNLLSKKLNKKVVAGVTTLACLGVPVLMAEQNWDDHDRSGRYTARDFAMNYLNSCAPNAVLFTNGDNDTFPLWYAQEVEGVRTDVRVVNLSLLNTDWYIQQMLRKAYESEALPLSSTPEKIVQGMRDYLPVYEQIKTPVDVKKVVDFFMDDRKEAKVRLGSGDLSNYIPTKTFIIPVDSSKVVNNGSISKKHMNLLLPQLEWNIGDKSYLLKSELMILDLLANNNWDRPVYFAITVGSESYLNLDPFFRLDGLAYRLVPMAYTRKDGQIGAIDTDVLYDNLMNKFRWGNINDPNVYLDENNLRMTMNLRNNFARLAEALLDEGKRDSAVKVLDRCMEVMPGNTVPFNMFVIGIAEGYFRAGEADKALAIVNSLKVSTMQELDYYLTVEPRHAGDVKTEARRSMLVMQEIIRITRMYSQEELSKTMDEQFKIYYDAYLNRYGTE